MACNWITNSQGDIVGAKINGTEERSKLFDDLNEEFGMDKAMELFAVSESTSFKDIFGGRSTTTEDLQNSLLNKYPNLKTLFLSETSGVISLDMIEVEKDERSQGIGSKVLEDIKAYADTNNLIIDLVPSVKDKNIGTTSRNRLIKFYKTLGFLENKGRNKDFSRRTGGMFREPNFKPKEPSKQNVIKYVIEENKTEEKLTKEQLVDLQDFSNFNAQKLQDAFYDKNGFFIVSESKLVKSGLYNEYEASSIARDTQLQSKIKNSIERLKNTPQEELNIEEIEESRSVIGEFNSFGKLVALNSFLAEKENEKQADTFIEVDSVIRQKNTTETEITLQQTAKQTENNKVVGLLTLSLETLQNNEGATREVLNEIEDDLIEDSIDIIGLKDQPIDESLIDYLSTLNIFIEKPSTENTKLFAEKSDEYFKRDLTPKKETVVGEGGKEYVKLNTELSEEEVYNQQGLIKVDDNTYLKTAKEDLATLYENVRTYKEKYPKDKTLEEYVQEQIANYSFKDAEVAEAVVLYKMYFSNLTKADVIDKLKATKLAKNVYELTSAQIEAKLVELGVDANVAKQVSAWHGSPYSFDHFTTNAMGTGEGAQAFGWGLYFTDLEGIARNYAKVLSSNNSENIAKKLLGKNKIDINSDFSTDFINSVRDNILTGNSKEELINSFKNYVTYNENLIREIEEDIENYPLEKVNLLKELSRIKNTLLDNNKALEIVKEITDSEYNTAKNGKGSKNLYKVSLHKGKEVSEYTWLEWDKPLTTEQKNLIREKALKSEKLKNSKGFIEYELTEQSVFTGNDVYASLMRKLGSDKEASIFLLEAGIDGIKYPAESISRGTTSDTARGFNYVVFDENAITIEEQIQFKKIDLTTNGFVYNGDVYLNSDSVDLITPIHEFNHLYNKWLKENREDVYMQGLSLIEKEINNPNSEIKDIIEFVKTNQPNLSGEKLKEEILTELVGRRGIELINSNKKSDLVSWLKSAWESIQDMLGLSNYSSNQIAKMNLKEFLTASAVDLLRGNPIVNQTSNFTGDYQYLTEEFPSDFYSKFLAEKKKNSKLFRTFYSNFEINEKGINIINTDPISMRNIRIYADENLRQYSILSKQMPNISDDLSNDESISERDNVVNNPQTLKKFQGKIHKLNNNEVIVKNNTEQFIKIGDNIYEAIEVLGNLTHFAKVENEVTQYHKVGIGQPTSSLKLADYNYLNDSINAEDFKDVKELFKRKDDIKEQAKKDGTFMLAPNGKKSNLSEANWLRVRTDSFKEFFGDWQNDPENASKVVDENGEPLLVLHGTNTEFNKFESRIGIRGNQFLGSREVNTDKFFFTDNLEYAEKASNTRTSNFGGKNNIIKAFINLRNPLDFTTFDYKTEEKFNEIAGEYPSSYFGYNDNLDQWWRLFDNDEDDVTNIVKEKGYDGVLLAEETKSIKDNKGYDIEVASIKSFGTFSSNQIQIINSDRALPDELNC